MERKWLQKLVQSTSLSLAAIIFSVSGTFASVVPGEATAITQSESYEIGNVEIGGGGGFVCGIIYSETEEGLVYCRTDMGGVYRRDKATQKWIPLLDWVSASEWNLLGGESLAIDPVNTNRVYVAAGTYTNEWTDMNGYILRSDDYGETWEKFELPFKLGGNMPGRSVGERLAIDPNSPNILYFAARSGNGLWKSTDYGETWSQVAGMTNHGNFVEDASYEYTADNLGLTWVTFDSYKSEPGAPTKDIYIGVADKENPVYVSHDAGKTFEPVAGQPTAETFTRHNSDALEIGIPHHGVITETGMLYVTYCDRSGPYQADDGAVFRYDTVTGEWTDITPYENIDDSGNKSYNLWFGFGGISVDKQNPNTLIVTSLQSWWPDNYIWRSTDCGETWFCSSYWGTEYMSRQLNYTMDITGAEWLSWGGELTTHQGGEVLQPDSTNPTPKLGWMMGDIEINPFNPDEMMYGTGATIYGCDNLTNWNKGEYIDLYVKGMGIEETAVLSLMCPLLDGVALISGLNDICGFVHEDITVGPDCMMLDPTFTGTTSMDYAELNPNLMVRVGTIDQEQYESIKKAIAISSDGGATWSLAQPNVSYIVPPVDDEPIPEAGTVAMNADGSAIVWAPNNYRVLSYIDGTWKAIDGLPRNAYVCSDRVNPDVFYAYAEGCFYVSKDKGATFTCTFTGNDDLYLTYASKIKAVPGKEGHVWIPGSWNGLSYTTDGGQTFTILPDISAADVVGFGMAKAGSDYPAIYSCMNYQGVYGVYRSDDMAQSWVRINDDEHQYGSINYAITGDMREYGTCYFGTNGRGVIYCKLLDENEQTSEIAPVVTTTAPAEAGTLYGDVNCDGIVSVADTVLIARYISQDSSLPSNSITEQGFINADCDRDNEISSTDMSQICRYLVGLLASIGT